MDRGDGIGLTIDRTLDATTTFGREAGRQAVRIGRVDQLHGDAVGALLRRRCARLGPARLVERHAQTAAPAVARLRLELTVEVGPATETLERHGALGRVAAHDANAGRARARRGIPDARALEHGHMRASVRATNVECGAEPDQPSADDDDRARRRLRASL